MSPHLEALNHAAVTLTLLNPKQFVHCISIDRSIIVQLCEQPLSELLKMKSQNSGM